ncbi:hypothetical protein [Salinicola aestuarinus]|uniref:hypothetical protein n=1 Tax=Salinicola aestuarinus TaxID=1949082 RepID=UPI0013004FEB|nr:hypothetical protein [Salinicola aestuarinus]
MQFISLAQAPICEGFATAATREDAYDARRGRLMMIERAEPEEAPDSNDAAREREGKTLGV